jgi:hypothetical protein
MMGVQGAGGPGPLEQTWLASGSTDEAKAPAPPHREAGAQEARAPGAGRNEVLGRVSAAWGPEEASAASAPPATRTPAAEVAAAVDAMFASVPALDGVDPRVLEMLVPKRDLAAECRLLTGDGLLKTLLGKALISNLGLPANEPYTSVFRPEVYRETGADGVARDLVYPETIDIAKGRVVTERLIYPWTVVPGPDGQPTLATSLEPESDQGPTTLIPTSIRKVDDYRSDPELMKLYAKNERVRALIGDTPPDRIEMLRVDMEGNYDKGGLEALSSHGDNILLLNKDTGERMLLHLIKLWQTGDPSLLERAGQALAPDDVVVWEVTGYRETPRTETFDPTKDPALAAALPPGHAEAAARIAAAPRAWTDRAEAAFAEIGAELGTGLTDWVVTDREAARCVAALSGLDAAEWLAVLERLKETSAGGDRQRSTAGGGSLLEKWVRRGIEGDRDILDALAAQARRHLGVRTDAEVASTLAVLGLR